jgi:hypothetical protein
MQIAFDSTDFLARVFDHVVDGAVYDSFEGLANVGEIGVAMCRALGFNDFDAVSAVGMVFGDVLVVVVRVGIDVQRENGAFGCHFCGWERRWLNDVRSDELMRRWMRRCLVRVSRWGKRASIRATGVDVEAGSGLWGW